jgi:hypothetical protein
MTYILCERNPGFLNVKASGTFNNNSLEISDQAYLTRDMGYDTVYSGR